MASLLMPTRKVCGRYVCHNVSVTADRTYYNRCTGSMIQNFMSIKTPSIVQGFSYAFETFLVETPTSLPLEDHYTHSHSSKMLEDSMDQERDPSTREYIFNISLREITWRHWKIQLSILMILRNEFKNWFHSRCKIYSSGKRIAPKSTESPTSLLLKIPCIELSQSLEPSRSSEKISHQFIYKFKKVPI